MAVIDPDVPAAKETPNSQAFTEFKGKFLEKLLTEIKHTTDQSVADALNKLRRELCSNDGLLIKNLEGRDTHYAVQSHYWDTQYAVQSHYWDTHYAVQSLLVVV